ncbi:general odorant-binding protein 83a-like [Contarinia nasturtii]|uniref:general odorant-binding protein 83a-like n=1 Tax=Contarinia nasturtii TaxID=265458 RepID=UPI0012D465A9|nr:general odorant-binding protein 83a-like [Contarinia nasturtii]
MFLIRFAVILSICFDDLIDAFGIRNSDSKPPQKMVDLTKPMHDLCVRMTHVPEEVIQDFVQADISQIEDVDNRLKCYMYCFLHEVEHFDFSEQVDRVSDLLTDDENDILVSMIDKCESLEYSKDPKFDACDYAFELEKCWKKFDPKHYYIL